MSSTEKEELLQMLFNAWDGGLQLIELIHDAKGKVEDFRYLEVNREFEKARAWSKLTHYAYKPIFKYSVVIVCFFVCLSALSALI
jgi:steroid 5-alpha reductase family enzyme